MNVVGALVEMATAEPASGGSAEPSATLPPRTLAESVGTPSPTCEWRWRTMIKAVSLCPACSQCPAVEIDEHEVRIGEGANSVTLSPAEWNVLVQSIKRGELDEVKTTE
jgi:hypothetical protein